MTSYQNTEYRRQKVLDYVNKQLSTGPLVFTEVKPKYRYNDMGKCLGYDYITTCPELDFSSLNLENAIILILKTACSFSSTSLEKLAKNRENSTAYPVDTDRGRLRSAFDIWRHLKYYYNQDITIFQVMWTIHELVKNNVVCGQYCCTVHRRVFWLRNPGPSWRNYFSHKNSPDEFRLHFTTWGKLLIDGR